jgi:hypothetical protein
LIRRRIVAMNNTLPAAKSMIAAAGSWRAVVCRDVTLLDVRGGRPGDTDVGGANDRDEELERVGDAEGKENKVLGKTEIDE